MNNETAEKRLLGREDRKKKKKGREDSNKSLHLKSSLKKNDIRFPSPPVGSEIVPLPPFILICFCEDTCVFLILSF